MKRIQLGSRGVVVAAVAVAALALAGGIAYATIPDGNKVFTACMLKSTGTVRLIDKSLPDSNPMSHCNPTLEIQETWNQQGQPGTPGATGAAGKDGVDGKDGQSVTNAAEAPGTNCPNGGARFSVGNGLPTFACNGRDGKDGVDGTNGSDGASVTNAVEQAGSNCAFGGSRFTVGSAAPTFACNGKDGADGKNGADGKDGANGTNGADGTDGVSVTSAVEPAGAHCANGGSKFTAVNGVTYACNGAPGGSGPLGQFATTLRGTGAVTLSTFNARVDVPGLSQTLNVPPGYALYVSSDGGAQVDSTAANAWTQVAVYITVDGTDEAVRTVVTPNATGVVEVIDNWSMSQALLLSAGQHTVKVTAALVGQSTGTPAIVSGGANSFQQGALTLVLLKA